MAEKNIELIFRYDNVCEPKTAERCPMAVPVLTLALSSDSGPLVELPMSSPFVEV